MSATRQMTIRKDAQLFVRWLWAVYVPLTLLALSFALFISGILPAWGYPILGLLAVWGLVAMRLVFERRRVGLSVRPTRPLLAGTLAFPMLAVTGAVLVWVGIARLSSNSGVTLTVVGGGLMVFAGTAVLFKLVDVLIRAVVRFLKWSLSKPS